MPEDVLKASLFGTSNAIMKDGYSYGLENGLGGQSFDKFIVGASTSHLFPLFQHNIKQDYYDLVFLEFTVNDFNLVNSGDTCVADIVKNTEYALSKAISSNALPIILIWPSLTILKVGTEASEPYREVIRRFGVPYFDGYAFVKAITTLRPDMRVDALFRDNAHLHAVVSFALGEEIGRLSRSMRFGASPEIIETGFSYDYIPVTKFYAGDPRLMEMSSSIMKDRFLHVTEGEHIRLPLEEAARPVALAFDATHSAGAALVSNGTGEGFYRSVTDMYFGEHRLVCMVLPMMGSYFAAGETVDITVQPELANSWRRPWWDKTHGAGKPAELSMLGLVVEIERPTQVPAMSYRGVELSASFSEATLHRIADLVPKPA